MRRTWRGWLLLGCGALLAGCGGGGAPSAAQKTALSGAQARWSAAAVRNYHFTYAEICFCLPREDILVTVRDGAISGAVYQPSGTALTPTEVSRLLTVEGLFGKLTEAYNQHAVSVSVTYNPTLGYPEHIFVDYSAQIADEEMGWRVTGLARD